MILVTQAFNISRVLGYIAFRNEETCVWCLRFGYRFVVFVLLMFASETWHGIKSNGINENVALNA